MQRTSHGAVNSESSHQVSGAQTTGLQPIHAQLNTKCEELTLLQAGVSRGTNTKDVAAHILDITRLLESTSEVNGSIPIAHLLGHRVVCNVLHLVLNRIVEPALKHYCSKGAAAAARRGAGNSDDAKARNLRSEVIRPFRLLVDAVHYNLIDEPRTTQRHVGREPPGAQPQPVPTSHTSSGARNGYRKQDAAMGNGHPSGVGAPLSESTSHAPRMAPLTWKQCAPLNILLSHILEVISSDTLVRVVGAEYASLMEYLLTYDAYSRQLTPKFATDLCVRAIALMERVGYEHTPESELEERLPVDEGVVYANLLAQLFCSPSASSWFRISDLSGHGNERVVAPHARRPVGSMPEAHVVVTRVVRLLLARHAAPSTSLKLEARTIRALRHMMRALHEDHLEASREAPLELVKVLCDLFVQPVARRRESWQLEVLEFVVLQLSLSLSQLLGDSVLRDLEELALQRVPSSLSVGRASRVSAVSPRYHALIHDTILPMALHLLCQQPQMKYEYSFVSRRELFFCPCPALDVVFHFGAVVVYAASVLHSQHPPPDEPLASDLVEEEAHGERRKRSRGAEATELAAQRTAATDHRSPAERFTAALMAVSFLHVDTDSVAGDGGADVDPPSPQRPRVDATESVVIPRGEVQDGLLYLLQTLALPCTSLHFTSHQCDALVTDCILPLHDHYGSAMTSLLVSVLCALAPRCSPKIRHRVLSWAIMRHVPSGGSTQVEHGAEPREEVYRLLSVLLQSEILKDGTEAVVDAASASSTSVVTALRHLATSSHFTQVSIMADSITRAQAARVRNAEIRLATSAASPGSLLDAARGGALHLPRPEVGSSSLTSCTSMSPPLLLEMLHTLTSYECHALVRRDEVAIEPSLQLETSAWTGLPFVCASLSYATIFFDNRGNKSSWGLWEKVLHQVENYVVACALHANLNQDMPVSPGAAGSITNAFTAQGRGLTAGFIARQREEIRTLRRTPLTQVPAILTEATAGQWLLLSQPPSTEDNKVGSEAAVFPRHVVSETFLEVLAGSVRQAITVLANRAAMAPKEAMLFVPSATAADASRDGYGRNSSAVDEGALEQLHLCLGVQCVQLLHFLLRLRRRRLWLVPEEVCSRGDSVLTTEAGGGSYNDAEVLQSATDFVKAPADVMRVLSPHGVMHYAVLWICRFLAERLLRGPLMLWLPLLQALHPLMADVGHELLTPSVACAESRQVIMNMVGVLVRRLLPDGIQKLQRSGATPLFFSAESSSRAVKTVCVCADLLRIILATAHKTKVLLSSADPLLESGTVREVLVTTFQAEGLLGETTSFSGGGPATLRADEGEKADARLLSAEDAVNVPTTTPPFLLPAVYAIGRLLWMLHTDYGEQGARLAVLHLTHTLYFRFRYNMMESIFALLEHAARACADYTSTNSGLDFVYEGRLLEWLVDTTAPQDEVHQRGSPHGPALTTSLQCAMLSSIFWTTPLCSPRVAEKLGKYSFTLLSAGTPYEVRRHTASQVHVLFDRFSNRTESVLRELLLRAREGMMSTSESLCSTSLLALSEAARAAPWLESRVIFSSAIESWATREFQLRPQLLQFLNRIATFSVDALHYRNTRLEQDDQRTCVAPYARLCRVHLRSLLFQWLWECGHDVDAFPAECVGYHSVDELLRHHLDIVLPLAMLVCGRSAHSSPGGPGRAASRDDETDAMLLYQPDPLLHRVLRHAAKAVEGSAGWSDDGAPMIPLLAYFPTITAQLSVLAHAGTHNQPSETHRRPRSTTTRTADEELLYGGPPTHQRRPVNTTSVASAELQDAATAALHWMHQLMNYRVERTHICVALHHMAYSAHPGFLHDAVEAHVDRLEKAAGSGVRFVNVLLLTLADRILVHMVELLGDALPFAPTEEVLQRVMQQQLADPAMTAAESLGILTTRPAVAANNGLDCLFLLHDGHMAYTLFQWLYARLVEQPSSDDELSSLYVNGAESACCLSTSLAERRYASRRRQARYLGLLLSMCKTWMSREVLRQPHVLRTIVGVATHLIRICPEHQRTVGDILLHVWGSVSGGVDAASSPLDQHLARQQRIWPNDILLASSLLAQVEESPVLASTWTALCRCDPLLAQRDWQLLSTQYSIHQSIQRETEDDEVVIVEDDAQLETEVNATSMLYTSPSSLATQKHARALLPLLQHLRFMGGSTSARCFDTLARTIDEAHHGLSQMIGRGAALKGRGSGAAYAPQRSPEDPRNSEQRLCVIFHDSCCQAVVDLLRMLLRVRHDGVEDQDPMEARHFASSSLPLQQAGMRLLRSISWCFVESGEVVALETFVRGQLIDVGGDAAMVMDAVEDDRATISSLHPVDLSIGHLFGKLLSRLYASAFDSDSALASQASHALELWLQQDARPALPEDSSATRKSSQSMAAWPVDQSILHLARFCCRLQLVKESATQAATSALDLSSSNATVDGDVMDSGSLMTMVALAAAAMESARWRPFQRFGLPHGPSAPPSSTFSLLDERVWHELSTHHNERGFLTLFVIGAMNSYGIPQRYHIAAIMLPLLEQESPLHWSSRRHHNGSTGGAAETTHWGELWFPIVLLHIFMLPKESDKARDVRSRWSSLLDEHLVQHAREYPLAARLLLHTLETCRRALQANTRLRGLKAFQPSKFVASNAPPAMSSLIGQVPTLTDMKQAYWLSDIGAQHLAEAALQLGEVHLAQCYAELSGESLLGPAAGIPNEQSVAQLFEGAGEAHSVLFPSAPPNSSCASTTSRRFRELAQHHEIRQKLLAFHEQLQSVLRRCLSYSGEPSTFGEQGDGARRGCSSSETSLNNSWAYALVRAEQTSDCQRKLAHGMDMRDAFAEYNEALVGKARLLMSGGMEQTAAEMLVGSSLNGQSLSAEARACLAEASWRCSTWDCPLDDPICDAQVGEAQHMALRVQQMLQPHPTIANATSDTPRWTGATASARSNKVLGSTSEALLSAFLSVQQGLFGQTRMYVSAGEAALLLDLRPTNWLQAVCWAETLHEVGLCSEALQEGRARSQLPSWRWRHTMPHHWTATSAQLPTSPGRAWEVLEVSRQSLAQLYGTTPTWRVKILINGCKRSLAAHRPHQAYRWLRDYSQSVEAQRHQWQAAQSKESGSGNSTSTFPVEGLSDEVRSELTILHAQALFGMGRTMEAIEALRPSELTAADQPSPSWWAVSTPLLHMPSNAHHNPEAIHQLLQWHQELQLVPLSQLVRDPFLSPASARNPAGACCFRLALLCHTLATDIATRLRTTEYQRLIHSVRASREALETVQTTLARCKAATDALVLDQNQERLLKGRERELARDIDREEEELQRMAANYNLYRRSALHNYGRFLQQDGDTMREEGSVHAVFGFVELWLQDEELELLKEKKPAHRAKANERKSSWECTQDVLAKTLGGIPTAKVLPVFAQLAARLGTSSEISVETQQQLHALVLRVACDHPLETVWHLLALAHGQQFDGEAETNRMHAVDISKVHSAQSIITAQKQSMRRDSSNPHNLSGVFAAEQLSAAYIELAFYKAPSAHAEHRIPADCQLLQLCRGGVGLGIPPPTVRAAGRMVGHRTGSSPPTILEYALTFSTPGGINVPKVLTCTVSDGHVVKQLLKSRDDLRQDAMIEQVFDLANELFLRSTTTAAQYLYTYKVVPLAPRVGILEWVSRTIPFGEYLTGAYQPAEQRSTAGAHERYFPLEPSTHDCRQKMKTAAKDRKIDALRAIYSEFSPALHYYFLEHYSSAKEWVERRRTYERSAATSSMVGFVVGLGDRHASNILLHLDTADMVHIDLGIAFDQNRLLHIPELVPFRLSRNVVDGLGVLGTSGGFRSHCEAALAVLRSKRAFILTILEPFLYDPLARWSVVPLTVGQDEMQRTEGKRGTPAEAQRTLARVSAKLAGHDGVASNGAGEQLPVNAHVAALIQSAQSIEHLSVIYEGWTAWL